MQGGRKGKEEKGTRELTLSICFHRSSSLDLSPSSLSRRASLRSRLVGRRGDLPDASWSKRRGRIGRSEKVWLPSRIDEVPARAEEVKEEEEELESDLEEEGSSRMACVEKVGPS